MFRLLVSMVSNAVDGTSYCDEQPYIFEETGDDSGKEERPDAADD